MQFTMSRSAYHSSSGGTLLWLGICLLGVAGTVATVISLGQHPVAKQVHWGEALFLYCLPFFGALSLAVCMDRRMARKRHQGIGDRLASMGFDVTLQPTDKDKAALFGLLDVFKNALDLRMGPAGLKWAAFRNPPGVRQELVGEFQFTTGSGKSTVEHTRVVALFPDRWPDHGGVPIGWPAAAVIQRRGKFSRRLSRKNENKDPVFSGLERRWAIFGDTETARRILTPSFNQALATAPRNEIWCLGGDHLCCGFQAALDAENLVIFLERVKAVAGDSGR